MTARAFLFVGAAFGGFGLVLAGRLPEVSGVLLLAAAAAFAVAAGRNVAGEYPSGVDARMLNVSLALIAVVWSVLALSLIL